MNIITLEMVTATRQRKEIICTFRQLIEPTSAQPGCLICRLLEDLKGENSNNLVYLEGWQSEIDLQRRLCSKQFRIILAMMELSSEVPEFRIHTISRTRGLDAIKTLLETQTPSGGRRRSVLRKPTVSQE